MSGRLKIYFVTVLASTMVGIKCPHCDEGIELDDDDFGFFECPFCEEEFEWNPESTNDDEELFVQGEFWFGSLVPFLTALLGIFFSYIVVGDTWDLLGWLACSCLLWPILAIGIGIYGFTKKRKLLWFGAATSLAVAAVLMLLVIMVINP